jgi:hypothetical protein
LSAEKNSSSPVRRADAMLELEVRRPADEDDEHRFGVDRSVAQLLARTDPAPERWRAVHALEAVVEGSEDKFNLESVVGASTVVVVLGSRTVRRGARGSADGLEHCRLPAVARSDEAVDAHRRFPSAVLEPPEPAERQTADEHVASSGSRLSTAD